MSFRARTSLKSLSFCIRQSRKWFSVSQESGSVSVSWAVQSVWKQCRICWGWSVSCCFSFFELQGELPGMCRLRDRFGQSFWFLSCWSLSFLPTAVLESHALSEQVLGLPVHVFQQTGTVYGLPVHVFHCTGISLTWVCISVHCVSRTDGVLFCLCCTIMPAVSQGESTVWTRDLQNYYGSLCWLAREKFIWVTYKLWPAGSPCSHCERCSWHDITSS